jgi:hypothetical protein
MAGVFTLVEGISILPLLGTVFQLQALNVVTPATVLISFAFWGVAFVTLVVAGLLLIRNSTNLAARSFTDHEDSRRGSDNDLHAIAFSVLGVALFCFAVPSLVAAIVELVRDLGIPTSYANGARFASLSRLLGGVVQLLLGVFLFCGSDTIVEVWYRLRGRREIEP